MARAHRVLVIGGGIGGLAAALALARAGNDVDLVESAPAHTAQGFGIAQPGNALRALKTLGVYDRCLAAGYQSDQYRYFDDHGEPLATLQMLRIADPGRPAYNFVPRLALLEILASAATAAGARIHLATTVADWRDTGDALEARLSNGMQGRWDLMVGADGIRSGLRRQVFGDGYEPRFTGCAAWRVAGPKPTGLEYQGIWLGLGMRIGMVPLSPTEMFAFVVTNEPGNPAYPPEVRARVLAERLDRFDAPWVIALRDLVLGTDSIVYTPLEEVVLPPPWHKGRVLLVGDAAHASSPHVAQGASMAIEDAVVLAETLAQGLPTEDTLVAFTRRRHPRCKFVQDHSRKTGEEGQIDDPVLCAQRNERLRTQFATPAPRPHEIIMQEPI